MISTKPNHSFLGDTTVLVIPLLLGGIPFDPFGWTLIFTLKSSANLPDDQALVQKITGTGIEVSGTNAIVTLISPDTATAEPGVYVWDVQAQNLAAGTVRTVASGRHELIRDVTRSTSTSRPVYTTDPGAPGVIPVILRTAPEGPPDETVVAVAIGQLARVGDASPYAWYRWDGTAWENLASGGGGTGSVTSVAISATGLSVTGSPITGAGTIQIAVLYGTAAGTSCQGNDSRLSNARPPTSHKTTHSTGGSDPISPADIGAQPAGSYVVEGDSRLGDARFPTPHKSTHATGGPDALTPADIGAAPATRSITAGTGLTGGGDLSANRTLAVSYGTSAGTACEGNDARLSDARTPTAHKSTHATGGSDALTPSDIGAVATSALSTTATANSVVQRDGSGAITAQGAVLATGTDYTVTIEADSGAGEPRLNVGGLIIDPATGEFGGFIPPTSLEPFYAVTKRFDGIPDLLLVGNNIATAIADATVTVTVAAHQGRWLPLTGSSGTQTIAMPASPALGAEFYFERRGAAALAFGSGFTVANDQLSSVPVGGVFGMKCVNTSTLTYLFL